MPDDTNPSPEAEAQRLMQAAFDAGFTITAVMDRWVEVLRLARESGAIVESGA